MDSPPSRSIVFVKTRHHYDSYTDYWRLVELSGFDTCYVDEIDPNRAAVYIISPVNGELRPHLSAGAEEVGWDGVKCKLVWWNLERPDNGYGTLFDNVSDMLQYVDAIWVSDRHYARLDDRLSYVTLGSHPGLFAGYDDPQHGGPPLLYDFAHMSYVHGRREAIMGVMSNHGLVDAPNGWGADRAASLEASRSMLNIHQTPAFIGEPLRFALAAAYSLVLLSEHLEDPYPMVAGVHYVDFTEPKTAAEMIGSLRKDSSDWIQTGSNLHQLLCEEFTFERCVREAVKKEFGT